MRTFLMLAIVLVLAFATINAATPTALNYQGRLTDPADAPVADGSYSVTFIIHDAAVAGDSKWTETQNVTTTGGLFSVILGSINPILDTVFNGTTRYLGVTVDGDPEMTPRTALISVPYAQRVSTVDGASGGNITSKVSIGSGHTNSGSDAFVAGDANIASGDLSTVGGGTGHDASAMFSTIGGGRSNSCSSTTGTVGGGVGNIASGALASTVAGGESNTASASRATVGGGSSNIADDDGATVGGGRNNKARGQYSVVAGGGGSSSADSNLAGNIYATVSGGHKNVASAPRSAVGGGTTNTASGDASRVGGGLGNTASDNWAVVGGGVGNEASGKSSTIPGGADNLATGNYSFAAGGAAHALNHGAVVIVADQSPNSVDPVKSSADGQMVFMATTAFSFTDNTGLVALSPAKFIQTSTGGYLSDGGTWVNSSDRNKKENFTAIDREDLLEKIATLPISRWSYKDEDSEIQHIGPVAQDFHETFDVGVDDKSISTIDPSGIALAAIQELYEKSKRVDKLESELAELKKLVQKMLTDQE